MSDEPSNSHPFRYRLRVRYDECDAQRVVFNARYGNYIDLAVTEFLRAMGLGSMVVNGALDYQLVKQTIEWKAPARFDDVMEISVRSTHQGNTSFTLRVEFRLAGSDALVATAETIYVLVDAQTLAKTPLPNPLRHGLREGTSQLVDHADIRPRGD